MSESAWVLWQVAGMLVVLWVVSLLLRSL